MDFRRIKRRFQYWLQRDERQRLFREEMEIHIEAIARDLMEEGMNKEDARAAAHRRFGNMTLKSEAARDTWIARWAADAWQDLQYTFRTLRRDAGFTAFAILIVGLGIGASSTIFSVVNTLLVRPLPFKDPQSLVWLSNGGNDGDMSGQTTQVNYYLDVAEHGRSFSEMAAYFAFYGVGDSKITGDGEPERVSEVQVSQSFFPLLGVQPMIGRLFTGDECKWNGPRTVLLSYGLWKTRFAGDLNITSRKLIINDKPVTIAGVLPESFDFSSVFAPASHIDLYSPFPLTRETNRWGNTLAIIARLKPGVTIGAAEAETAALGAELTRQNRNLNSFTPKLTSLEKHVSGRFRPALFVLACAVGVVMLIVCANLSNLQLARAAARQKEMAIRSALGAGRYRLIRQMLTESIVLSCCGAILGLILAIIGTRVLAHLDGMNIPLLASVHIDARSLGFTLLIAVFAGLIFGMMPALQVPSIAVHNTLKDGTRGASGSKHHAWIRSVLVVSEIAFACVLLVGAGLLIRSFLHVLDVNLGFHPERAAALRVDPSRQYDTPEKQVAYFNEALRSVRSLPGIEAAGLTDCLPLGRNRSWGAAPKGYVYKGGDYPEAFPRIISDGYFKTMGIPLRSGRDFTEADDPNSKPVIIINETMARRLWPGQNALGQLIDLRPDREVVGIVGDVRHIALEQGSGSEMYIPIRQTGDRMSVDLVVRTSLSPPTLASAIRGALRPIEPNLPANEFRTLQTMVDKSVSPRRFVVILLGGFAGFALILASLGIYAVISYSVAQRTQEIGIRMALGASARDLQAGIIMQTLALAAAGIALGITSSWFLAQAIAGLLYGVTATDPTTFVAMLIVLTLVAILAGYLPARRASRIDPMIALRAS